MLQQVNNFSDLPNVAGNSGFHRWRNPERLVNPAEVIVHKVEGNGVFEVIDFLGKAVGQPGKSPVHHSDSQVLPFDIARGNILHVRIAHHRLFACTDAICGAVSDFAAFLRSAVQLHKHGVVNVDSQGIFNGPSVTAYGHPS